MCVGGGVGASVKRMEARWLHSALRWHRGHQALPLDRAGRHLCRHTDTDHTDGPLVSLLCAQSGGEAAGHPQQDSKFFMQKKGHAKKWSLCSVVIVAVCPELPVN